MTQARNIEQLHAEIDETIQQHKVEVKSLEAQFGTDRQEERRMLQKQINELEEVQRVQQGKHQADKRRLDEYLQQQVRPTPNSFAPSRLSLDMVTNACE